MENFEKSLGMNRLKLMMIDRVLHRYSTNGGLSMSQLEKAFSEMGLNFVEFENFYQGFYRNYEFNLNLLNCLGILVSMEPAVVKLKILFQNYDCDTSGSLSRDELAVMIRDLTEVACVLIPKGAKRKFPENEKLAEYFKEIISVRKSLNNQILYSIIEDRETITEREFILSYQNDEATQMLLSPKALRQHFYSIKKNIIGSVQNIMRSINQENEQVFNIINYKPKKLKKSKPKKMNIQ